MTDIQSSNIFTPENAHCWSDDIETIDFEQPQVTQWHIDTRDFGYTVSIVPFEEADTNLRLSWMMISEGKRKYYINHFWTTEEVKNIVLKLFKDSGGKVEWRMLSIDSPNKIGLNWKLKYLRIYKTPNGLMICNSDNYVLTKELFYFPIEKKYLHTH
jgi:hypothetical protein